MEEGSLIRTQPTLLAVSQRLGQMILSASGWRTVFAADGAEESLIPNVPDVLRVISGLAAMAFSQRLSADQAVVLGTDTRPTGPAIQEAVIRVFCARGIAIHLLGVATTPEIIAYANRTPGIAGFFYVSASHNPAGHNGLKMGLVPGGVLGGQRAEALITAFRELCESADAVSEVSALLAGGDRSREVRECGLRLLEGRQQWKQAALDSYAEFVGQTMAGPGPRAPHLVAAFRNATRRRDVTIVGDLNGSARAASIDRRFFENLGITAHFINAEPGRIAHQIVPEGSALQECRRALEQRAREAPPAPDAVLLGYVPDNDGDRGNLVYYDNSSGGAQAIDAQSVFAIACVAELAWLEATGALSRHERVAVVVNGPTSLRVERIAQRFGVEVVRAEVGEANVLRAADELRERGYLVRLTGEGSNGGTIVHPALVRDPLNTVAALLKLLITPAAASGPAPIELWAEHNGLRKASFQPTLSWLIGSLPSFTTTSAYEDRAVMRISEGSTAALKRKFEANLPAEFNAMAEVLERELAVVGWQIINYEGTSVRHGAGNRSGRETGGMKIALLDRDSWERGFLWMRGSKTEPVFRIMVDVEGEKPELEQQLLSWLRGMVDRAGI